MLLTVLRILSAIVGSVAFYVCLFMYEDEEGKWQNRIDNLWLTIDDKAKTTGRKTAALFDKVSVAVNRLFDRIFGSRLFSLRAVGASTCYSVAVACAIGFLSMLSSDSDDDEWMPWAFLVAFFVLMALAVLPSLFPSRWFVGLSLFPAFCGLAIALLPELKPPELSPSMPQGARLMARHGGLALSTALFASLLSDFFLVALIRSSIRWITVKASVFRISVAALTQACVIILLMPVSWNIAEWLMKHGPNFIGLVGVSAEALVGLSIFTALTACTFLFVLLFVFLHKVLWPILGRLLYPLARYEVIRNRKMLTGIGTVCYSFASPLLPSVFKSILALAKFR